MRFLGPLARIAALCACVGLARPVMGQENCFERSDNQRLSFDVFQIGTPPYAARSHVQAERSHVYPGTDYATTSMPALQAPMPGGTNAFRKYYFLWVNRCIFLQGITPHAEACRNTTRTKGNGYPAIVVGPLADQLRIAFSTYRRANACTMVSAMRLLGEPQSRIDATAHDAGITVIHKVADRAALSTRARSVVAGVGKQAQRMRYLVDECVIEPEPMGDQAAGVVLDYEVFDNRTPAEATAFLRELQALLRGHRRALIVNTNPLPRAPNGLTEENARTVLDTVDGLIPTLSSGASLGNEATGLAAQERKQSPLESYAIQLGVLKGHAGMPLSAAERRKLAWNVSLHDTTMAEARKIHDEVRQQGYRGVMLFRNYVRQGGACSRPSNQLTACLAFGTCDGGFGSER